MFLFLVYLGMIAWCCFGHFDSLPKVSKELFGIPTDKVAHFIMFSPFVILGYPSFASFARKRRGKILVFASVFLGGLLVACATEAGQALTDYRSGDPADLAADAAGLVAGAVVTFAAILILKHRTN